MGGYAVRKQVGRWPDGWFDGNVVQPTYIYRAPEQGEHKYKTLSNGNYVLKIKRSSGPSVFYIWNNSNEFYDDVKKQYPELQGGR